MDQIISYEMLKDKNLDQLISLYNQGYTLSQMNDNIYNINHPDYQNPEIRSMLNFDTLSTTEKILVVAGVLILGYLVLAAQYKIEGSAAHLAGQQYIATPRKW